MSKTQCVYPQVGALKKAEDILGQDRTWNYTNEVQEKFINDYFDSCKDEIKDMKELEDIVSWDHKDINKFLKDRNFDIELERFEPGEFGTASVLDVKVEWLYEGELIEDGILAANKLDAQGKKYDAAKMDSKTVEFYEADGHNHPIAKLLTKDNEYSVYMTVLDKAPKRDDMMHVASDLQSMMTRNYDHGGLVFPCVDLDEEVDLDWMLQMYTFMDSGKKATISQAKQQTKMRMNHKGARAKSGVAVGVTLECAMAPGPDYVIDKDFLVWFEKPGLSQPLCVGYITEENWKYEGDLDDM